jgi:hypothetical protein
MYSEEFKDLLFVQEQSVSELSRSYKRDLPLCNVKHTGSCEMQYGGSAWYGGITKMEQATSILENGWAEGAEKAAFLKDSLQADLPKARTRKRKQTWLAEGDSLDVDRALAGNWDYAYRGTIREWSAGVSCVTLNIGWGGNCNRTSEELFWSGAVMLCLSDILEGAGFSTKINAVIKLRIFENWSKQRYSLNTVTVKDHGEPMRVDALAGVVCHAGIFRTYGFRTICNAPWDVSSGLGQVSDGWEEMNRIIEESGFKPDPNTINVNDCYSREDAIREVTRILKGFNPNGTGAMGA